MKANRKPYVAKSLSGAQAYVRRLGNHVDHLNALLEEYHKDRIAFAKLAADGPAFYNPIEVAEAKARRDYVLKNWCRLNPDGSPLASAPAPGTGEPR